jgi:alpha-beta hydrolase superfamily lysophospholipase
MIFKTADNRELFAHQWHVDFPKGVIVLVHGQGEHAGRYAEICQFFNENKYAVVGFDQQGHGKTAGIRGDSISTDSLLDDVGLALDEARQRYPGTPLYMYGHSYGGHQLLTFLIKRRPTGIRAAIIGSPLIDVAKPTSIVKIWAGQLLKSIAPKMTLSNDVYFNGISRDPEVLEKYANDPLTHGVISARAGIDIYRNNQFLKQYAGEMPVKTLLLHGTEDKLTSFAASKAFVNRVKNIEFIEYPGLFHELHNEPEKHEIWKTMLRFLDEN